MVRTRLNIGCRYSTPVLERPLHPTRSQFKPQPSQTQAPVTPATEPERRAGGGLTTRRRAWRPRRALPRGRRQRPSVSEILRSRRTPAAARILRRARPRELPTNWRCGSRAGAKRHLIRFYLCPRPLRRRAPWLAARPLNRRRSCQNMPVQLQFRVCANPTCGCLHSPPGRRGRSVPPPWSSPPRAGSGGTRAVPSASPSGPSRTSRASRCAGARHGLRLSSRSQRSDRDRCGLRTRAS